MKIKELLEAANDITNTPAFKKWFGNSKIVDASGKPLVVYHGTVSEFNEFEVSTRGAFGQGIYLTTSSAEAERWAGYRVKDNEAVSIMPLYVRIETPLNINVELVDGKEHANINGKLYRYRDIPSELFNGYDGIIVRYKMDGIDETNIIAFSPNQVKSIYNKGTFSNSPNILESILNEKITAPVYHVTTSDIYKRILKSNELKANTQQNINGKLISGISTTRDLQVAKRIASGKSFGKDMKVSVVIIKLDAEQIGHTRKIVPIDYFQTHPEALAKSEKYSDEYNAKHRKLGNKAEAEEFIVGNLPNVKNYIIDVLDKTGVSILQKEPITEARTAPLYHATGIITAAQIVKSNELHGNSFHKLNGKEYKGISLTRSLQFAKYWGGHGSAVILVLNQEKLSHNYKFLPIDYFSTDQVLSDVQKKHERRKGAAAEAEEFLLTTNLKNLDKYLTGILIPLENLDSIKTMQNNIFTSQDQKENINFILNHPKLKVI